MKEGNITIDNKIIQLQSGYRILVDKIEEHKARGMIKIAKWYTGEGEVQIAGFFGYRGVEKVLLLYDENGKFLKFTESKR